MYVVEYEIENLKLKYSLQHQMLPQNLAEAW